MSRFYQALKEASRKDALEQEITEAAEHAPKAAAKPVPPAVNGNQDWVAANRLVTDRAGGGSDPAPPKPEPVSLEEELASPSGLSQQGLFRISPKSKLDRHARVIPNAVDQAVVEHYRRLRTKLIQQQASQPFRSLLITSASPQEGKTVTCLNLGLSCAMLPGFKVLLVDGDIRRGSMGKWLGADEHGGLSNLIDGSANLDDVVLKDDDLPVYFMARGNSPVPAGELLHSPQLSVCFQRMTEFFSLVLIDSPPVNMVTDAQLLANSCDAILLVTRAFVTTRKSLERTVQDLQSFRVLGTVLNCGTRAQSYQRYRGYY